MSSSVLERVRSYFEDTEQYEEACSEMLVIEPKNHRDEMLQKYLTSKFVDKIEEAQRNLQKLVLDNSLAQEYESLKSDPSSTALYAMFYQKFQELKEYNRKFPDAKNTVHEARTMLEEDYFLSALEELKSQWSTEEGLGRFLDLQDVHRQYLNLPEVIKFGNAPLTYTGYLTLLKERGFVEVPLKCRMSVEYASYLESLRGVLRSFFARSQPFLDLDVKEERAVAMFEDEWREGKFKPITSAEAVSESTVDDVDKLLPWNLDCDPSSTKRVCVCCANREFAKNTVWAAHLSSLKHKRSHDQYIERIYKIMRLEVIIFDLSADLADVFESTRESVERRQARVLDGGEDEDSDQSSSAKVERKKRDVHRMKKNYPIDADGTPMPYWMYKLQGLNHKFVCEICGNEAYFGRRTFERHFSDYKHTLGLACLGLENCKEFHEISHIKDAIAMGKRLDKLRQSKSWDSQVMEECEDENGVILDRQTYDLLAKQFAR